MTTFSNSLYASLKKEGLQNWNYLDLQKSSADFNEFEDLNLEIDNLDEDWFILELEEQDGT